jgi:putative toxin-antitoxin system antitoxin component (TIGR02293 family)
LLLGRNNYGPDRRGDPANNGDDENREAHGDSISPVKTAGAYHGCRNFSTPPGAFGNAAPIASRRHLAQLWVLLEAAMTASQLTKIYEELKDELRRGAQSGSLQPAAALSARELEVRALANRIFGDETKADAWLNRPNPSLSGQVPIDLLSDELGAAVVRETLEQIDHGIFA